MTQFLGLIDASFIHETILGFNRCIIFTHRFLQITERKLLFNDLTSLKGKLHMLPVQLQMAVMIIFFDVTTYSHFFLLKQRV